MASEGKSKFSLVTLFVVVGVVLLLALALVPAVQNARLRAKMLGVASRGKDIVVAIISANTEREPLGLTNVWPKTHIDGVQGGEDDDREQDFGLMTFQNSTDYFHELWLFDHGLEKYEIASGWHGDRWNALDYSSFAGAGVPVGYPTKKLQAENNMWSIVGDLSDDKAWVEDYIPVLVTRNVDCASFYTIFQNGGEGTLEWSGQYKIPHLKKGFIIIRKGGSVFWGTSKYARWIGPKFDATNKPPRVLPAYLTPDSLVTAPQRKLP